MGSPKISIRKTLKSVAFEGIQVSIDRERRAQVVEVRATDRMKGFAGREDQGLSFTVRMPEQSVNRVDLLFQETEFPGTVSVYLDPDKQGDAFAWRASFDRREDGALIFNPALNGGDLEDYLARKLHEAGLLVLRKEGRAVVGAPLFCDGKRDEKEKVRTFVRETLTFVLVKAEIERRLVYPPGMEPPPLELPAGSASRSRSKSKKKAKPPASQVSAAARIGAAAAPGPPAKGGKAAPPPLAKGALPAAKGAVAPPKPPGSIPLAPAAKAAPAAKPVPAPKAPPAPARPAKPPKPKKPRAKSASAGKKRKPKRKAARPARKAPRRAQARKPKKKPARARKPARRGAGGKRKRRR